MKKRMYMLNNIEDDNIYFHSSKEATDYANMEMSDSDFNDEDMDERSWTITVRLMTEQEIADLPEYNG